VGCCIQKPAGTCENDPRSVLKSMAPCTTSTPPLSPPALSSLQVHAVDEVIGLLRGERAGLLQLVAGEAEAAANHQQEEGGDDEAQSQGQDGTCWEEAVCCQSKTTWERRAWLQKQCWQKPYP